MGDPVRALLERLSDAVSRMRVAQKAWFGGDKSSSALTAARAAEAEVDRLLRQLSTERRQARLF